MSISPLITFKAGICEFDTTRTPIKVTPQPTLGYLYLYEEDELITFCWRPRSAPMSQPDLKLVMVPCDGSFVPYNDKSSESKPKSPTNGRVFVLKFLSSTQRHLFWMQSKSQHPQGDPTFFSSRDLKLGSIVDRLLQGDEVNVSEEVANIPNEQGRDGGDETMEDVAPEGHDDTQGNNASGNPSTANPGNESEGSREGGADGGRATAPGDAAAAEAVQNFLRSMQGNQAIQNQSRQPQGNIFTTLSDLLPPQTTIPFIDSADSAFVDNLLSHLPPILLLLSQEANDVSSVDPDSETAKAAIEALSLDQKKEVLRKVLRSPQFYQSLSSLTVALRDGGLPTISEALKIPVREGGYINRGGVPLGGGDAVEAFLDGVKEACKKETGPEEEKMDVD